ncbi:MAG: BTAD domain-containing putative transcriptional regulator [Nitrospirota bacterium]
MKETPSFAKITAPRLPEVYPRKRLFKLLDQGHRMPITWVSAPAGAGKTTLIRSWIEARKLPCLWYQIDAGDADLASFFYYLGLAAKKAAPRRRKPLPLLTPEYLMDVPTFSRRYFEDLCARVKTPFFIIFDNYQDVPPESPFHSVLASGLAAVPEGVRVICLSRSEPLPAFSGLIAGSSMKVIGWDDLRLSPNESRAIVGLHSKDKQDRKTLEWMYDRTQGWAAGLVLMARAAKARIMDHGKIDALPREHIFDYFATELFAHADVKIRDFLVHTSALPTMSRAIAERLTGNSDAGTILEGLYRRNYFTYKSQTPSITYQYHPLFREFLQTQMKNSLNQEEIAGLQRHAATLLEESGQAEEAAGLFIEIKDWRNMTDLVMKHAPVLAQQGRSMLVLQWIGLLPAEMSEADPWLLYWTGACRSPYGPADGRPFLEKAFRLFEQRGDPVGALLAWAGATRTYIYEYNEFSGLDPWLDWIENRLKSNTDFPSLEIEAQVSEAALGGLIHRRPRSDRIKYWVDRALAASRKSQTHEVKARLLSAILQSLTWLGEFSAAERILEQLEETARKRDVSLFSRVIADSYGAILRSVLPVSQEACLQDLMRIREAMRSNGIVAMDTAVLHLAVLVSFTIGDRDRTGALIDALKPLASMGRNFASQYHYDLAWHALITGKTSEAVVHAGQAVMLIIESGAPFPELMCRYVHATALFLAGERKQASEELGLARNTAESFGSSWYLNRIALLEAEMAFESGDDEIGLKALRQALELGRKQGYFSPAFHWRAEALSRLCARALEEGIETTYTTEMIRLLRITPESILHAPESWPWPLKIYTLGRFRIEKNGKPLPGTLRFSRKVPQKPLELLKLLIALGNRGVKDERIIDALWPDAEGDAGKKSLSVTVTRLRDLLGLPEAVIVAEGAVSLNERLAWTDARAFEKMLNEAVRSAPSPSPLPGGERIQERGKSVLHTPRSALERALALYQGAFLDNESGHWAIPLREKLRELFVRSAEKAGRFHQERGEWDEAAEIYRRGLGADELVEQFYVGLMSCHRRQGRPAEAKSVYLQCKRVFDAYELPLSARMESEYCLI